MAKRPPFYHIPGGGPPSPLRDAQIKALTPSPSKAAAAGAGRPAIAPILTSAPAPSFTAQAPLRLENGALILAPASGARGGYLIQSDWIQFNAKEPPLGNPAANGQALVSTTAGARSWVTLPIVPSFADSEAPAGVINGANTSFTLAHAPSAGSVHVYSGATPSSMQRLSPSQYSVSGATLTFTAAPATGTALLVDYRY
ncbi:hypothetical protein CCAX7_53830 [Capsulimonas corticalis]|uniref:Uncharacterized protein n=1 Tax=Capsulimonas corticalis TaxID=2219043 RepID=A0A402CNR4_9BACT|nr:hypothetical protein [Capsulimonas corticalis]BDI33332.1 hypothetical protein CCAX7_53830 [Capsulimonas corticalis]